MAVTVSSAFVLVIVLLHAGVIAALNANLSLVYVSSRTDGCEGPRPIVQLSARSRERDTNQPFGGWNLIAHYTGNCSSDQSVLLNSSDTFSQYQFRVELSQGAPCHCVTLASISHSLGIVQEEWNNGTFWCGEEQPSGPMLCASEHSSRFFISRVVQIEQQLPSTLTCAGAKFSTSNTQTLAVAYSKTFFGTCPSKDTCFPWKVVENNEKFEDSSVSLKFTLSFNKQQQQAVAGADCSNVSYANEGVLLQSTSPSFAKALRFFYTSNSTRMGLPLVEFLADNRVKLTSSDSSTTVSRSFVDSKVLNVSLISSELANNKIRLQWKQLVQKSSSHCRKWSLSNVNISLHHDSCTRNIFENNFEPALWALFNSTNSCNGTSCLNFASTIEQQNVVRTASTVLLDLSVITGRMPPPAPTFVPDKMKCSNGLTLLEVKFELIVRSFRYPTPCADPFPHGINMTVSDVPVAYFAPIANTRWSGFNATSMSFTNSDGNQYPVYHPRQNSVTVISTCVNTTGKQSISIAWEQKHFLFIGPKDDHWFMYIEQVKLGGNIISDFNRTEKSQIYSLHILKDREDLPAPSCFSRNKTIIHLTNPFPDFPRVVNLTLNLTALPPPPTTVPTTSPTPLQLTCFPEGSWLAANACSIVTNYSDSCPLHSTATRICYCNGTWANEACRTVYEQDLDLIDESPKEGLARMMTLSNTHANGSQWFYALNRAVTVQLDRIIDEEFVKIVVEFVDRLLNNKLEVPGVELLILLDKLALNINLNTTVFLKHIGLSVQEVNPNSGDITAIQYDDNYITLPQEIFKKPAFVGSFYFNNISHLIPGEGPISPVISSVVRCSECVTSNLTETVKIQLSTTNDTEPRCVFANLKVGVSDDDFWNVSGCSRVQYGNGTVVCECTHLTHFAILLSPGVELPANDLVILTTIGQVFVSVSLVFLLVTIFAFILFRSLWSMRAYIHIMLCANLFIAQLLFITGVGQTENPTTCSAIAVVLHYSFLVVFMWMLMEGIVLYVMLVRVFITHHARYMAAFTIASYGIPLVYIAVVAPIGFLVNTDSTGHHYSQYNSQNDRTACWLRYDTHFVWAFIAPVVLIILVNCGFLIMALVITYRHYKKQEMKGKISEAKHWMKVVFSLMLVLGIVWIGNLLFFHTTLTAVAYIMVILISGQGFFIFILFVPMSKQVRDAYKKWWKIKKTQSSFLSRVFPSKSSLSLPAPTTKKLYRSKTALANYYDHKIANDDQNHTDKKFTLYVDDQIDTKKSDEEKFELTDKKWNVPKRKVLRRATVTNVYGDHVMEIYKNCGTTESCSDVSKSEEEV